MRVISILSLLLLAVSTAAADETKVVDPSGKTVGIILDCNSCKDPSSGESCFGGAEEGFHNGKRCGKCLLESNFGIKLLYAHDLKIIGTVSGEDGKALADEFVRLYLPNSWTVRTRTSAKGYFRLLLGATEERQGKQVELDLGNRKRAEAGTETDYALYMLPENYKPCAAK